MSKTECMKNCKYKGKSYAKVLDCPGVDEECPRYKEVCSLGSGYVATIVNVDGDLGDGFQRHTNGSRLGGE